MGQHATGDRPKLSQKLQVNGVRQRSGHRFRKPLLYPLSYEGARPQRTCQHLSTGSGECPRYPSGPPSPGHRGGGAHHEHTAAYHQYRCRYVPSCGNDYQRVMMTRRAHLEHAEIRTVADKHARAVPVAAGSCIAVQARRPGRGPRPADPHRGMRQPVLGRRRQHPGRPGARAHRRTGQGHRGPPGPGPFPGPRLARQPGQEVRRHAAGRSGRRVGCEARHDGEHHAGGAAASAR
jgi:hypothetical protein